jgi:hypothetical protein
MRKSLLDTFDNISVTDLMEIRLSMSIRPAVSETEIYSKYSKASRCSWDAEGLAEPAK